MRTIEVELPVPIGEPIKATLTFYDYKGYKDWKLVSLISRDNKIIDYAQLTDEQCEALECELEDYHENESEENEQDYEPDGSHKTRERDWIGEYYPEEDPRKNKDLG